MTDRKFTANEKRESLNSAGNQRIYLFKQENCSPNIPKQLKKASEFVRLGNKRKTIGQPINISKQIPFKESSGARVSTEGSLTPTPSRTPNIFMKKHFKSLAIKEDEILKNGSRLPMIKPPNQSPYAKLSVSWIEDQRVTRNLNEKLILADVKKPSAVTNRETEGCSPDSERNSNDVKREKLFKKLMKNNFVGKLEEINKLMKKIIVLKRGEPEKRVKFLV